MSKKFNPTEKNIQHLLKDLGADQKPYPKDLLNSRRAAYLSQVTSVVSAGSQLKKGKGQGGSPNAAPMTPLMKVILTALIVANVALAGYLAVTAYENWDKIQELLFGVPSIGETSPAPLDASTQPSQLEATSEATILPEESVTPVSTPEPTSPSGGPQSSPDDESQVSTPEPDGKDNPGKHLGQTPGSPPGQDDKDKDKKDKKDK